MVGILADLLLRFLVFVKSKILLVPLVMFFTKCIPFSRIDYAFLNLKSSKVFSSSSSSQTRLALLICCLKASFRGKHGYSSRDIVAMTSLIVRAG